MESWRRCNEEASRSPRRAVLEWLGRGSTTYKRKAVRPRNSYQHASGITRVKLVRPFTSVKKDAWRACDHTELWGELESKMDRCEHKIAIAPVSLRMIATSQLVGDFNERAERWRRETSFQSSLVAQFMHEDYQSIMAKGAEVIPLILRRLQKAPESWFWALKHLAGEDAAKDTDNPTDAAEAWLRWGRTKGYIE